MEAPVFGGGGGGHWIVEWRVMGTALLTDASFSIACLNHILPTGASAPRNNDDFKLAPSNYFQQITEGCLCVHSVVIGGSLPANNNVISACALGNIVCSVQYPLCPSTCRYACLYAVGVFPHVCLPPDGILL